MSVTNRHEDGSFISPHWAKFQFWQNQVIHGLFSDTLDIVSGYDPRIHKESDNSYSFSINRGKPTTISSDVAVVGKLPQQYQDIVHSLYRYTAPKLDEMRNGQPVRAKLRRDYEVAFDDTEDKLLKLIKAEEFRLFQGDFGDLRDPETLERLFQEFEKKVTKINPQSPILKLLRAGIIPTHPALNFIPRESGHSKTKPDGTFLELRITSFNRMRQYISSLSKPERPKIENAFTRTCIYSDICSAYDQLMLNILQSGKGEFLNDHTTTLLYQLLERVLTYSQAGKLGEYNKVLNAVSRHVNNIITTATNKPTLDSGLSACLQAPWQFTKK